MGGRAPYEIDRLRGIKNGKGIGRHPVQHQLALVDRASRLYDQLLALDPRERKAPQLPDPQTHPELHRELHSLIGKQPGAMGRPRGSRILPSGQGPTDMGPTEYKREHRRQRAMRTWEEAAKPDRLKDIKNHYEQSGAPIDNDVAEELYRQEILQGIPAIRGRLPVEETADRWPVMDPIPGEGERLAATKPKPKVRTPEEVWYDVHKHPEGVPGGMGKSPEYHLRNRGWTGHEINEGSGRKTVQYRNHDHPDFVVSYGGGTGTKPDHNFRVLYMGTNSNIPKVTRARSVAEAMNRVDELHQLHNGLVVQPMTHDSAYVEREPKLKDSPDLRYFHDTELRPSSLDAQFNDQAMLDFKPAHDDFGRMDDPAVHSPGELCETCFLRDELERSPGAQKHDEPGVADHPFKPFGIERGRRFSAVQPFPSQNPSVPSVQKKSEPRDMTDADAYPQFPSQPEHERTWMNRAPQLKEIPDPPPVKPAKPVKAAAGPDRTQNDHGTLAGRNRHRASGEEVCPLCRKANQVYNRDPSLYRELVADSGGLIDEHLHTTSPYHDRVQEALTLRMGKAPRHPEGLGPADLGRAEYSKQYRQKQRLKDDTDVAQMAGQYGMDIQPEEVARYRGLRGLSSVLQIAQQDTWEDS